MFSTPLNSLDARTRLLLWLVPAFFFVLRLGGAPLFDVDEGAFSEATRYMLASGDYLSTWLNGAPRFDKPILIYWLQAASVWLVGINEWGFRLPSAIAAAFWCQAIGIFTAQRAGKHAGWMACIAAATSIGVHAIGRAATADALLNMLLTLALLDIWRYFESASRVALRRAYLWIALGILTKGPVAVLVPGAAALLFALSSGRMRDALRAAFDLWGWAILLLVAAPWYIVAWQIHGQAFIDGFILKHNVGRFSGAMEGHAGSIFYYAIIIPVLLLPWLAWLLAALRHIGHDWHTPMRRFLWLWFIFVLVFFSLSGTKLPHYALYGCTPLFVLMALHRENIQKRAWLAQSPNWFLLALFLALPSLLNTALTQHWIKDAFYAAQVARINQVVSPLYYAVLLAAAVLLGMIASLRRIEAWRKNILAACVLTIALASVVTPLLGEILQGPVKRAAAVAGNGPAILWNFHVPSFSVYRQAISPTRQAEAGDMALTRIDRVPEGLDADVLYQQGGVVLLRLK